MHDGLINGWHENVGFYITLCMRGLAGLLLGGLIYYLSEKLKAKEYKGITNAFLFVVEIGSFAGVALIAMREESSYEMLSVILFIVSLSITFSEVTATSRLHGDFLLFLGKLSLPFYCIHPVVRWYFESDDMLRFYLTTLAASVVMVMVVEGVGRIWKNRKERIKRG